MALPRAASTGENRSILFTAGVLSESRWVLDAFLARYDEVTQLTARARPPQA